MKEELLKLLLEDPKEVVDLIFEFAYEDAMKRAKKILDDEKHEEETQKYFGRSKL